MCIHHVQVLTTGGSAAAAAAAASSAGNQGLSAWALRAETSFTWHLSSLVGLQPWLVAGLKSV